MSLPEMPLEGRGGVGGGGRGGDTVQRECRVAETGRAGAHGHAGAAECGLAPFDRRRGYQLFSDGRPLASARQGETSKSPAPTQRLAEWTEAAKGLLTQHRPRSRTATGCSLPAAAQAALASRASQADRREPRTVQGGYFGDSDDGASIHDSAPRRAFDGLTLSAPSPRSSLRDRGTSMDSSLWTPGILFRTHRGPLLICLLQHTLAHCSTDRVFRGQTPDDIASSLASILRVLPLSLALPAATALVPLLGHYCLQTVWPTCPCA
ncbi:hypothetical protein CC78DRAFT_578785 [Lojkania enalia]|uniref:Uncharacterized protein n=1 Tax=Lojkania enalia TaxID=147567 RepID=A0A9P4N5C1_9PLEO|nr:hypothetical protein CC78DRAFT_578785 [Didymosphaeria enalia]